MKTHAPIHPGEILREDFQQLAKETMAEALEKIRNYSGGLNFGELFTQRFRRYNELLQALQQLPALLAHA